VSRGAALDLLTRSTGLIGSNVEINSRIAIYIEEKYNVSGMGTTPEKNVLEALN
jgi:hypothetical protein